MFDIFCSQGNKYNLKLHQASISPYSEGLSTRRQTVTNMGKSVGKENYMLLVGM